MDPTYKAPRTVAEIQQEYQQLCLRSGHLQYSIDAFTRDLKILNDKMRDLNFEGAAAQEADAKAAKAKADAEAAALEKPSAPILTEVK